jgi:hypothetical protein
LVKIQQPLNYMLLYNDALTAVFNDTFMNKQN